ncbi:phospholipase ABHD3-like isoform X2 [Amphiura filiformis]|uniref:phospholipase ABHD3-like isoform X2 n=1 Tax=Amphiura filiformis TaxID=82378 RepID=UPI003B22185E
MADLDSTRYISDLNQAWVALGIGLVYVIYYITFVVKKPLIICGNPRLRDFIDTNLPVLNEDYWPLFWCLNGKFQTLLKGVTNKTVRISVNWTYRRDVLVTPDGGEICLDWVDNDKKSLHLRDERPTVIIVPGLSGSSGEVYSVHFFELVQKLGYRSVVFNNRGLGGCRLKTPRTFCPKNTEDFRTVVQHIRKDYPNAPLFALGASAGGLNLFHYLADYGKDCQLNGAMIVSVLYEMFASTKNLETFPNVLLFNQTLIRDLHYDMLLPNQDILRTHKNLDVNSILQTGKETTHSLKPVSLKWIRCSDLTKAFDEMDEILASSNRSSISHSPYRTDVWLQGLETILQGLQSNWTYAQNQNTYAIHECG